MWIACAPRLVFTLSPHGKTQEEIAAERNGSLWLPSVRMSCLQWVDDEPEPEPATTCDTEEMTIQQAARDAVDCQNACNSSGIARTMVEAMDAIRATRTTTGVNQHPIVFMFLYKLMALNGYEPLNLWDEYTEAEKACNELAATEVVA